MKKKKDSYKGLIYISRRNWITNTMLTDEEMNLQIAKCHKLLSRKPDINVIKILKSDGAVYPFDPVMDEFKTLSINRKYDCLVVPSFGYFASCMPLARMWVEETLIPSGFRYIDAGYRFDSLSCDLNNYMRRMSRNNRKHMSSRNRSN